MPHRIVLRIGAGVAEHFPIRYSEWLLCYPLLGWSWTLLADPNTFEKSTSFAEMARWGAETTWGGICFAAAFVRLCALVVNGTFKHHFPYSPHLRAFASLAICIFWGQISLGILISVMAHNGAWTGFFAYSGYMLLEIHNLFRAWSDVGVSKVHRDAPT